MPLLNVIAGAEADEQVRAIAPIEVTPGEELPVPTHFGPCDVAKEQEAPSDHVRQVFGESIDVRRGDVRDTQRLPCLGVGVACPRQEELRFRCLFAGLEIPLASLGPESE